MLDGKSLEAEVAEILAKANEPGVELPEGAEPADAIAAFVLKRTRALDEVALRFAREIDKLRNA